VRVSLLSVSGVATVDVSLAKGLATVKLKPGNTVSFKQLQTAIVKNGFTMKESRVVAAGKVVSADGNAKLQISGSNEVLSLVPESSTVTAPALSTANTVVVEGKVREPAKGKTPDTIRYQAINAEK
jgi:copper chaperone CopZ